MSTNIEEKIVFGLANDDAGNIVITLGIPVGAWEYIKDGKTNTFDFTKAGLPIRMLVYGAPTHDAAMRTISDQFAAKGVAYLDERRKDYSLPAAKAKEAGDE